jgi:hypothetical protein
MKDEHDTQAHYKMIDRLVERKVAQIERRVAAPA